MYRVVTQQRPAPRGRAALASGVLLALCLALAAWLTAAKAQGRRVPLEDHAQVLPDARLKVRLPVGWETVRGRLERIPGVVLELQSPRSQAEQLILFRSTPRPNGTVWADAAQTGRQIAQLIAKLLSAGSPLKTGWLLGTDTPLKAGWATIGPLPAWAAAFAPTQPDQSRLHVLVRTAIAPDGQIVGVLLTLPHYPLEEDLALLANVAGHLELLDLMAVDTPEIALRESAIVLEPPADARLFLPKTPLAAAPAPLLLQGGLRAQGWHLKVGRVPLVGARTIEQLVTDHARSARQQFDLPAKVQTYTVGDRATARLDVPSTDPSEPHLLIWSAQIDAQTALLLVGRPEPDGWESLERVSASIVANSRVTGYAETLDLERALEQGRQHLERLARAGLTTRWRDRITEGQRYVIHGPGLPIRHEVRAYEMRTGDDGQPWWTISVMYLSPSPLSALQTTMQEHWRIREDTQAHGYRHEWKHPGQPEVLYTQIHPPETNVLRRELVLGDRPPIRWEVTIDSSYGCEPVLIEVLGTLAVEDEVQPAVFTTTDTFVEDPYSWLALPLGEAPLPGGDKDRTGWLVRVLRDYDPSPIDLYFDADSRLWSINFGNLLWQQRIDEIEKSAFGGMGALRERPRMALLEGFVP